MAKDKKQGTGIQDAKVISEDIYNNGTMAEKNATLEVKNLILDPSMTLHRILVKDTLPTCYIGKPFTDFTADGYPYSADKFYVVITPDNKTYIVQKAFFDLFFVSKQDVSDNVS